MFPTGEKVPLAGLKTSAVGVSSDPSYPPASNTRPSGSDAITGEYPCVCSIVGPGVNELVDGLKNSVELRSLLEVSSPPATRTRPSGRRAAPGASLGVPRRPTSEKLIGLIAPALAGASSATT